MSEASLPTESREWTKEQRGAAGLIKAASVWANYSALDGLCVEIAKHACLFVAPTWGRMHSERDAARAEAEALRKKLADAEAVKALVRVEHANEDVRIARAVQAEREACADIADRAARNEDSPFAGHYIGREIRARTTSPLADKVNEAGAVVAERFRSPAPAGAQASEPKPETWKLSDEATRLWADTKFNPPLRFESGRDHTRAVVEEVLADALRKHFSPKVVADLDARLAALERAAQKQNTKPAWIDCGFPPPPPAASSSLVGHPSSRESWPFTWEATVEAYTRGCRENEKLQARVAELERELEIKPALAINRAANELAKRIGDGAHYVETASLARMLAEFFKDAPAPSLVPWEREGMKAHEAIDKLGIDTSMHLGDRVVEVVSRVQTLGEANKALQRAVDRMRSNAPSARRVKLPDWSSNMSLSGFDTRVRESLREQGFEIEGEAGA